MAKLKRVVFYAVNGSGLGHITRLLAVARWLRRYLAVLEERVPEIVFLTSSEATGVLLEAGFASFKVPSKTVVRQAGMDMLEYRRLARQFIWQMLGVFTPDLLVVDTFPSGSFDELFQLLDGPFRKALILRRVKPEYARRPIYKAALGLYPTIVVPHSRDSLTDIETSSPSSNTWTHTGEVLQCEPQELPTRAEGRAQLGVPEDARLVYVSAGGGGDPGSEEALEALVGALGAMPEVHLLVGAGPLYQGRRLPGERVTWFTNPQVHRFFPACDAALTAAGYNTFHELLYLRVPSAFYAQPKVADDQAGRVQRAEAASACLSLEVPLEPEAVRAVLTELLDPERQVAMRAAMAAWLPDNGASRAARALLGGIYTDSQLAWASALLTPDVAQAFEQLGADGLALMARWLPQLVPQARWGALHTHPSFQAMLDQLDPAVARAITDIAHQQPEVTELANLQRDLGALLALATVIPGGVEPLTALLDAAIKKHPLAQEPHSDWTRWIADLVGRLNALLRQSAPGWPEFEVAQVYRVFPRVADRDIAGTFGLFNGLMDRAASRGLSSDAVVQHLRVMKFSERRVDAEVIGRWIEAIP